ncbi:MAG: hypothetical protein LBS28_03015 [Streptococcaceae bacterium]|jgi:hypothetical protein|nr:hypothetical protein [Streptococcaceae bacterium]
MDLVKMKEKVNKSFTKAKKVDISQFNITKNVASNTFNTAKTTIADILRKNYTVTIIGRNKSGFFTKKITTLRPTSHSI